MSILWDEFSVKEEKEEKFLCTKKENHNLLVAVFFLVREAGLEPSRPE